jgi:hypothetical protein
METPELFESPYSLNSDKNSLLSNSDSLTGSNPLSPFLTDKSQSPIGSGDNWMLQQATNWFDQSQIPSSSTRPSPLFTLPDLQRSALSTADPLTGGNPNQLLVGANPDFAIKTAGTITLNGSTDLDGKELDPADDAKIYAAKGFTINGNAILPVQRDVWGNPFVNPQGKLILADNALTVSPGYTNSSANPNRYANLNPPSVIALQSVDIPDYATVKDRELIQRTPLNATTVTFNPQVNPINNASQWAAKFPPGGTSAVPKVVKISQGGLNIPTGVSLNNYIIIVEQGNILMG